MMIKYNMYKDVKKQRKQFVFGVVYRQCVFYCLLVVVLYVPGIYLQINKHIHMHITLVKYNIYLHISF